jgi:hypothetical protein
VVALQFTPKSVDVHGGISDLHTVSHVSIMPVRGQSPGTGISPNKNAASGSIGSARIS